jgi:C_GCAxxG_C_C family probable redox protein
LTKEEFKKIATDRAKENYKSGMNCSESTFKALLDTLKEEGLTSFPSEITALATGMGGGIGSTGNACGALLGAVMAAGIIHGRKNPLEKETLQERTDQMFGPEGVIRLFNNIAHDFKEINGSANCIELIAPYDYSSVDRRRFCKNIVANTTSMAVDWIFAGIEKGYCIPYQENIMGRE